MNEKFLPPAFFKALSDPTRLGIVQLLNQQGELCVCDITTRLNQPQPTISRHLNQLKSLGLLTSERRGTWIWYAIHPDLPAWCLSVMRLIPTSPESQL